MRRRAGLSRGWNAPVGARLRAAGWCTAALLFSGCAPAPREKLSSPNPFQRAQGAVAAARQSDASSIGKLVDLLEDPDRGVRMYAIIALKQLVGTDYGYRYYAHESERAAAVRRWRQALQSGEVAAKSSVAGDSTGAGEARTGADFITDGSTDRAADGPRAAISDGADRP